MEPVTPAPSAPTTPATPTTPVVPLTNDSADLDVIARAERARSEDRLVLAVFRRVLRWTLFSLLVVIPLLAIALPSCTLRFPCRSKQSEAKGNLKALYVAEESYRAEFDRYIVEQGALGWTPRGARLRYEYFVKVCDDEGFEAWAIGVDTEVSGDVWRIDENNAIVNEVNACNR